MATPDFKKIAFDPNLGRQKTTSVSEEWDTAERRMVDGLGAHARVVPNSGVQHRDGTESWGPVVRG